MIDGECVVAETLTYGKSEDRPELNRPFSHIYVEEKVFLNEGYRKKAEEIISHFPEAVVVRIGHYKDVFNRHRQNYVRQHEAQALILAVKQGTLVYPGAKVCQSMGNKHFYYTSCMMNCLFDCEYCYLKGMYPSGNMVIFLNLRDIFSEVEALLKEHPVYLCVSYDSDLMAIEKITGYVSEWINFTNRHPGLTIEIRTKAGNIDFDSLVKSNDAEAINGSKMDDKADADVGHTAGTMSFSDAVLMGDCGECDKAIHGAAIVSPRNIFAFTLSPDYVVRHYEHKTGSPEGRIRSVKKALELGFTVRLCFDPMIFCPGWRNEYGSMMDKVFAEIPVEKIFDFSVGSFRLSEEYLKNMRRNMPDSAVVQYPYENDHGVYHYSQKLTDEMETWMVDRLRKKVPEGKIFRWSSVNE